MTNCLNKATDLHHLDYDNVGDERLQDVMHVCRPCHDGLHVRGLGGWISIGAAASPVVRDLFESLTAANDNQPMKKAI